MRRLRRGPKIFSTALSCADDNPARLPQEADALAEFQRRGLFLTNVVECAAESDMGAALARCAPSLLKRIKFSYKPKCVAPISSALQGLLPLLSGGGLTEQLILDKGAPIDVRSLGVGKGAADFAAAVRDKLAKAASNSA
jgi:hypothetical protein